MYLQAKQINYSLSREFCSHSSASLLKTSLVLRFQLVEEGMSESLFDADSLDGVKCNHLEHEVQSLCIEVLEELCRIDGSELGEGLLVVWQLQNAGPHEVLLSWGSVELEDLEDLVDFGVSHEQGTLLDHLGKDAACTPHIHSQRVLFLACW